MGTFLLSHGLSIDSCLEELNLKRPSLILEIHRSYVAAGAEAIVANTFGANRPRLTTHSKQKYLSPINRAGVRLAKRAAGKLPVFASIGPLGREAKKMSSRQMFRLFKEQAACLEMEKPFGYLIETMPSLGEAEAATVAVREISKRPIFTLMTFPLGFKKARGETLELIASTLRAAGADVIGVNCGKGPDESYTLMKALSLVDSGPLCVRPAAGLPGHRISPEEFASWGVKFKKLGCDWIGGCCGTNPDYIRELRNQLSHVSNNRIR